MFAADFTQAIPSGATFARTGSGGRYASGGSFAFVAANAPRFDHDPYTNRTRGVCVEAARQQYVRNTALTGATVGVVGSGGAWPTNWGTTNSISGASFQVLGVVTNRGVSCLRVRISGTAGSTGAYFINMEAASSANPAIAAAAEVWTASAFVTMSAGSLTNISSVQLGIVERTSAGTFVAQNASSVTNNCESGVLVRNWHTRTLSGGTTARVNPVILVNVASGLAFDITLDIGLPNISKSAGMLPVGENETATGAETLSGALSATLDAGSLYASGYAPDTATAGVLAQLDDGTANNRVTLRRTAAGDVYATVVVGGVTAADAMLGRWANGVASSAAVAWDGTSITGRAGGGATVTVAAAGPSGITTWRAGSDTTGSQWGGTVSRLQVGRGTLLGLAVPTTGVHDDFIRADGAPVAPPGGRYAYGIVPYSTPTAPRREPVIASNKLTCPSAAAESTDGTTAGYTGIDLGVPYRIACRASFSAGTADRGNVTLISNANGLDEVEEITGGSVHITFTDANLTVGVFSGGSLTNVKTVSYSGTVTKDGATAYSFGWRYLGSNAFLFDLPNGRQVAVTSAALAAQLGRYVTWEHYWFSDGPVPALHEIYAESA